MGEQPTSRLKSLLRTALRLGWRSGLVLGGVWVAYDLINNLGHLDAAGYGRLNHGLLMALVAVYLWAGLRGAYRARRIPTGVLAAAGASLIGSAIALTSLWTVTYLFLDTIHHNPYMIEDFRRSGMHDMDAFIVDDNLVPTFVGPWLSLAVATVVGSIGAVIGKGLSGPGAGVSQRADARMWL
jgi:predicted membrane protein